MLQNDQRNIQTIKGLLILICILFIQQNVFAQLYYKSGTFKVENATKRVVFPGVMGSPVTTTVQFRMVMKSCTKLKMDSFWMDGLADKVSIQYSNGEAWDGKPMKGDTLMVSLEYFKLTSQEGFPSEEFGLKGSPESKPPMAHKGKALFRYSLAGKAYYFSIKEIKEMENVYAP